MIHRSESDPLLERVEKYYQSNGNLQDGIHGSPKHIGLDGASRGGLLRSASFKSLNDAFLPSNPLRRPSTAEQVFSRIEFQADCFSFYHEVRRQLPCSRSVVPIRICGLQPDSCLCNSNYFQNFRRRTSELAVFSSVC